MGYIAIAAVVFLMIFTILEFIGKLKNRLFGKVSTSKEIPRPPAYPILRHLPYLWKDSPVDQQFLKWANEFKDEGIFVIDPLLGNLRYCICKEEFVKHILVSNCYKYARSQVLSSLFPNIAGGLFASNGKEHAWQRKMLNPAFSYSSILDYVTTFDKHVNNLIEVWKKGTEHSLTAVTEVDIGRDFSRLTLDVIGETAFGYDFKTLVSGDSDVSKAVETIVKGRTNLISRVLKRFIPFYDKIPFKSNLEMNKSSEITHSVVEEIIQSRRKTLRQQKDQNADIGKDLLAKMMRLQDEETHREMTNQLLHSEVYTFMVAGHETTSVALTWTFYLLAKHPEIQQKARQECRDVIGKDEAVTSKHLESLTYVTAVIKESLRMFSPAHIIMRESIKEDKVGDYVIPKGVYIIVLVSAIHHLDKNWADHDKFIPERFLKEGDHTAEISNYKFMPFSVGPRICIGRKFSMAEMQVTVAKLLNVFKFDMDPNHPEVSTCQKLTLKPNPTPMVRVTLLNE